MVCGFVGCFLGWCCGVVMAWFLVVLFFVSGFGCVLLFYAFGGFLFGVVLVCLVCVLLWLFVVVLLGGVLFLL